MKGRHPATTQVLQADGRTKSLSHADGSKQYQTSDVGVGTVHSSCVGLAYILLVKSDILERSHPLQLKTETDFVPVTRHNRAMKPHCDAVWHGLLSYLLDSCALGSGNFGKTVFRGPRVTARSCACW